MDSEQDFRELVRKKGVLFTHNVGQGPEEWVLAIATPMLTRTQVATPADLVVAGYVRADGYRRLEAERDRLVQLLEAAERHRLALAAERHTQEAMIGDLDLRARVAEAWKSGEQAGIVARNREEPLEANPHDATSEDPVAREAHAAWRHGWRLREVLLDLNGRLKGALAAGEAVTVQAAQDVAAAETAETAQLRQGLDAQLARTRSLEAQLRTIWAEAPHAPTCALWTATGPTACDCWRARLSPPAPET